MWLERAVLRSSRVSFPCLAPRSRNPEFLELDLAVCDAFEARLWGFLGSLTFLLEGMLGELLSLLGLAWDLGGALSLDISESCKTLDNHVKF